MVIYIILCINKILSHFFIGFQIVGWDDIDFVQQGFGVGIKCFCFSYNDKENKHYSQLNKNKCALFSPYYPRSHQNHEITQSCGNYVVTKSIQKNQYCVIF